MNYLATAAAWLHGTELHKFMAYNNLPILLVLKLKLAYPPNLPKLSIPYTEHE